MDIHKIAGLSGHNGPVYAAAQGAGEHVLLSGGSDRCVTEWDLRSHEPVKVVAQLPGVVYALEYVKEKGLLLVGESTGGIHILDLSANKSVHHFKNHGESIFDIRVSVPGDRFYAASGDGSISCWRLSDCTLLKTIILCREKVRDIRLNHDHSVLSVACGDGAIRLIRSEDMQEIKMLKGHEFSVYSTCFHPAGKLLLSGARDARLNIWDIESGELLNSIPAHNFAIYSIVFSPSGKYFATGSRDKTIKIWDSSSFQVLERLTREKGGHINSVNRLLWLDYNDYLVSAGDDRMLMIWKIE